ncbi:MAG: maltose alpha-D-glucosyltransferase [Anaerolineales bacterium]
MDTQPWYKNAVFYEVYVRAFFDSNGDGHGDLQGLTQKLDYLQELGIDCIWLMPIYPSPLKDDGYDISDYYGVHPDYGTLEDFRALLATAHARGLRIITDLVVNHTSDQHPWFQAARRDPHSPYRDYYVWSDDPSPYAQARIIFLDSEVSNWTFDPLAGQYYWHRFYSSQPDLNYDNPAVRLEMLKVMKFWLDLGVDGFRVDAVPYLFEREGTNCENLPETHAYLKKMRRFVEEHYPDRILLCEANQWPRDVRAYFGRGDEFHMAFHFPLMPRLFMAIRRGEAEPIRWVLSETPPIPSSCQWCTFLRNHDELTLEMVSEEERRWMWQEYAPEPRMRLNLGIRRRLASLLDHDQRKIELAYSLLFTLPGSPILYYGDEIGMGDDLSLPDRNGLRTPMQWEPGPAAGFSTSRDLYSPLANPQINVAAQRADPTSLWQAIRRMIAVRKAHPALGSGELVWIEQENRSIAAYWRTLASSRLLVVNNLSGAAQSVRLPIDDRPFVDALNGRVYSSRSRALELGLSPYEYRWLRVEEGRVNEK